MRTIDANELRRLLPMSAAIDALEAAFSRGAPDVPLRQRTRTPDGELLLMPAASQQGVGVKLITITPSNPARDLPLVQGVYTLFAPGSQTPIATLDGAALTEIRTAAVSAVATRHLALEGAHRLLIFGTGVQARSHAAAMREVRPIDDVIVVGRTRNASLAFAEDIGGRPGTPTDVQNADLICTCTTSSEPLFEGARLAPGAHVNAVGASTPDARELDTTAISRARVVVETRQTADEEAGDILIPIQEGAVASEHVVADLSELVRGARVRHGSRDITVFVSVGMAFEDLVVARAALDQI